MVRRHFSRGRRRGSFAQEIRQNPLLWLLALAPVVLLAEVLKPDARTLLFMLSVLAIVPLAVLLSHATESVAARTGDAVGGLLNATLAGVTVLVALVSEVFVESVQQAETALGRSPAFVGFVIVALVGAAAEMVASFSAARKNRLDLSVGIALGSAVQIALFVAPILVVHAQNYNSR